MAYFTLIHLTEYCSGGLNPHCRPAAKTISVVMCRGGGRQEEHKERQTRCSTEESRGTVKIFAFPQLLRPRGVEGNLKTSTSIFNPQKPLPFLYLLPICCKNLPLLCPPPSFCCFFAQGSRADISVRWLEVLSVTVNWVGRRGKRHYCAGRRD